MPRRRCVGCGRVVPKPQLVRLALAGGDGVRWQAVIDTAGTMPGRGAYLCRGGQPDLPVKECLELARKRGGVPRALRCSVTLGPELVESTGGWRSQSQADEPGPSTFLDKR